MVTSVGKRSMAARVSALLALGAAAGGLRLGDERRARRPSEGLASSCPATVLDTLAQRRFSASTTRASRANARHRRRT